jgi:S1-C subfamily serine protease
MLRKLNKTTIRMQLSLAKMGTQYLYPIHADKGRRLTTVDNRVLKIVALVVALALALGLGAVVGGGLVYALTHVGGVLPIAQAQAADPGYGVVVASVVADGPAAKAGLVRGDILLEINGNELENSGDLTSALAELSAGDEVTLTVLHGDVQRTLTATLGQNESRAYLGLTLCGGVPGGISVQLAAPGARIVEVMPDSPAEQAGLQPGDVIVAVDGTELDAEHSLSDLIATYKPGDQVTLEVEDNDGESREVQVKLGQNPDQEGSAYLGVRYSSPRFELPMGGRLPFDDQGEFQFDQLPFVFPGGRVQQGAIIRDVTTGSPAAAAGLKEGDVIAAIDGEPVQSPKALSDAIAGHEPGDRIALTVYRSGEEQGSGVEVTLGSDPNQDGKAYLGVSVGSFFHIQPSGEGNDGGGSFEFFGQPFEWPFTPPSDGNSCDGGPGCPGESA